MLQVRQHMFEPISLSNLQNARKWLPPAVGLPVPLCAAKCSAGSGAITDQPTYPFETMRPTGAPGFSSRRLTSTSAATAGLLDISVKMS